MQLYKEYSDILRTASYLKEFYKKVYLIFEGKGGDQIVTGDILPNNKKIREVLILNPEMEQTLNFTLAELQKLVSNDNQFASYGFYFAQYGGSKTQILNMIQTESDEIPNVIPILFEDLKQFQPRIFFEKLLANLFFKVNNLPQFMEDRVKYRKFFAGLNDLIANTQISFQLSKNLKRAEDLIDSLWNTKNPTTTTALTELRDLLHSSILVDNSDVLNKIIQLMQYCSQNGFTFLFLIDEVDLWLNDESVDLELSADFLRMQNYMKQILEIPDNRIHCVMIFACTDRVNSLLHSKGPLLSARSPAGSRWVRIYENAEKIVEPGNYGDQITQTLVKLAAYHSIFYGIQIPAIFFDKAFLPLSKKYTQLSRRNCNSKIIQLLKNFQILEPFLNRGQKEWDNDSQRYGSWIESNLESIFRRLSIKFVREQIQIDPTLQKSKDKLDGYFVNLSLDDQEIKTNVEIKLTKNFKGEKAYQVLQWLVLNPTQNIIMIIFSPTPMDEIKKEIITYAEKENFPVEAVQRIKILLISEPYAFFAINGMESISTEPEKLNEFFNAYANWLDFFGEVANQYQTILHQLGINDIIVHKKARPSTVISPSGESSHSTGSERIQQGDGVNGSSLQPNSVNLTSEGHSALVVLTHMYKDRLFTNTGRISKQKIQALIQDKSLGISNLEILLEYLHKAGVVVKITDKFVNFDPGLMNYDSIDKFSESLSQKLTRKAGTPAGLTNFVMSK